MSTEGRLDSVPRSPASKAIVYISIQAALQFTTFFINSPQLRYIVFAVESLVFEATSYRAKLTK
jgi:hypothetical protein